MIVIEFVPYEPEHLLLLDFRPDQERLRQAVAQPGYGASLRGPRAWTGLIDGVPVGCGGLTRKWTGVAYAWGVFGNIPCRQWPRVVKKIRDEMKAAHAAGYRRIEATVVYGFGHGCRLANLLGFEVEGVGRCYGPDGSDHFFYGKVA